MQRHFILYSCTLRHQQTKCLAILVTLDLHTKIVAAFFLMIYRDSL